MNFTLFKYFDCDCDCSVKSEDYCFIVPVMLCGISFPMHVISEEKDSFSKSRLLPSLPLILPCALKFNLTVVIKLFKLMVSYM